MLVDLIHIAHKFIYIFVCRPTIFIEIIQRVGCMMKDDEGKVYQKGGCGGFGKGNFSELFKSIEEYEMTLEPKPVAEPAPSNIITSNPNTNRPSSPLP